MLCFNYSNTENNQNTDGLIIIAIFLCENVYRVLKIIKTYTNEYILFMTEVIS